jgi:hypothetical protein
MCNAKEKTFKTIWNNEMIRQAKSQALEPKPMHDSK